MSYLNWCGAWYRWKIEVTEDWKKILSSGTFETINKASLHYIKSHKKWKDSLETQSELAILSTYFEKQAILEPVLLYHASKWIQTKEQGSEDCLWTDIFTFLCFYYQFFFFFLLRCKYNRIKLCYINLLFIEETQISNVWNTEWRAKLRRIEDSFLIFC